MLSHFLVERNKKADHSILSALNETKAMVEASPGSGTMDIDEVPEA